MWLFLPVNQPYTMTVDQAARAARMFSPKVLYPYHYGSTAIDELPAKLKEVALKCASDKCSKVTLYTPPSLGNNKDDPIPFRRK